MENGVHACSHMKIQKYPLRSILNKTCDLTLSPCLDGARFDMKKLLLFNLLKNVLGLHRVTLLTTGLAHVPEHFQLFKDTTEDLLHF